MEGVSCIASEKGVARMMVFMLVWLLLVFRSLAVPDSDDVYQPGSPAVSENDDHGHMAGSVAVPDNEPGIDLKTFLATQHTGARYPVHCDRALFVCHVEIHPSASISKLFFELDPGVRISALFFACYGRIHLRTQRVGFIVGFPNVVNVSVILEPHYCEHILFYSGSYYVVEFRNETHVLRPRENRGSHVAEYHDPVIDENAGYPVLVRKESDALSYEVQMHQRGQPSESGIQYFVNNNNRLSEVAGIIKSALEEKADVVWVRKWAGYAFGMCGKFYRVDLIYFFTKYRLIAYLDYDASIDTLRLSIGCKCKPKAQQMAATETRSSLVLYEVLLTKSTESRIDLGSEEEYGEREGCYLEFQWKGVNIREERVFKYIIDSKAAGHVMAPTLIQLLFHEEEGPIVVVRANNGHIMLRAFIAGERETFENIDRGVRKIEMRFPYSVERIEKMSQDFVPIENFRQLKPPDSH